MTLSSLILLLGVLAIAFIIHRVRRRKTENDKIEEGTSRAMLIRCKACDREISRKARTCPHCGHSRKKKKLRVILIIFAIIFLVFHEEIHQALNIPDPVDYILHRIFGV